MIAVALCTSLACAGFAVGRWFGVRYEPGAPHYVMGLFLAGFALYLAWASPVTLDPRWIALVSGGYVGLSLGSFLRQLWREERDEREAVAPPSAQWAAGSAGFAQGTGSAPAAPNDDARAPARSGPA